MMFRDARIKIDRAGKHIRDVKAAVHALTEAYTASIEEHVPTGGHSIKFECPGFEDRIVDIALITGDAIHNLRTALDYAWVGTIERLGLPTTKFTKFPFQPDAQALENALKGIGIETVSSALFAKFMTEIKPYPAGNSPLCSIHSVDITDKHKLLVPVVDYSEVKGMSVENEHGVVLTGNSIPRLDSAGIIYFDFDANITIKHTGQISASILFHEGSPLAGFEISTELRFLSGLTRRVVEALEEP